MKLAASDGPTSIVVVDYNSALLSAPFPNPAFLITHKPRYGPPRHPWFLFGSAARQRRPTGKHEKEVHNKLCPGQSLSCSADALIICLSSSRPGGSSKNAILYAYMRVGWVQFGRTIVVGSGGARKGD